RPPFSSRLPRPPRSTPFPYTTLFRSNGYVNKIPFDAAHWRAAAGRSYPGGLPKPYSNDPTQWLFDGHPRGSSDPNVSTDHSTNPDRKSTRLNSSYVKISYAVFCLKKK